MCRDTVLMPRNHGGGREIFLATGYLSRRGVYGRGTSEASPAVRVVGGIPYEGALTNIFTRTLEVLQ